MLDNKMDLKDFFCKVAEFVLLCCLINLRNTRAVLLLHRKVAHRPRVLGMDCLARAR